MLSCSSATDCTQSQYGNVCGSGLYNASLIQTCGASTGAVWSMDDFCGTSSTQTFANIDCGAIAQTTDTFANMFGCNGTGGSAVSCYNDPLGYNTCCGCPTFPPSTTGTSTSWPSPWNETVATMSCTNSNSIWTGKVLPWLQYLKEACPTAYSFPFDDATSTFQCDSAGTFLPTPSASPSATPVANTMNYDVTFSAIGINATPVPAPTP